VIFHNSMPIHIQCGVANTPSPLFRFRLEAAGWASIDLVRVC